MAFRAKNPGHANPHPRMAYQVGGCCYVSFSGGKDSTVLLDLCRRIDPNISAVFIDTGLEYPEVRQFALSRENVVRLKPEMNFRKVIETYGYPVISKEVSQVVSAARKYYETGGVKGEWAAKKLEGTYPDTKNGGISTFNCPKYKYLLDAPFRIDSRCCDVMKKSTAHKYDKETGRKPIIGTMASESMLRKRQWLYQGCNSFDAKNPSSKPLSFWTEQDVLEYITRYHIPIAPVYGEIVKDKNNKWHTTGLNRTGCVFCAYGAHLEKEPNRFQRLKVTHPQLWEYCMKPWDEGGLGMKEVLEYIGVEYE